MKKINYSIYEKKSFTRFLLILIGNLLGCKKDGDATAQLDGIWIEQTDRSDTLIFEKINQVFFSSAKGTEARDGHQHT